MQLYWNYAVGGLFGHANYTKFRTEKDAEAAVLRKVREIARTKNIDCIYYELLGCEKRTGELRVVIGDYFYREKEVIA